VRKGLRMGSWQKQPELRRIGAIALVFWLVCVALLAWRFYGFYPSYATFDQGIFDQVFWNSLRGQWFQSSLSSTESIVVAQNAAPPSVAYHRLGQHFTPALMLWLPLYALFQSPMGLSLLQVTLVSVAGLVLYAIALHYHPPRLSLWVAASYYAANAVIGPTLANFHDFSQIPLFLFSLILALEKRWWPLFWPLVGLTLLVREDAGIVLFGVGALWALKRPTRWVGLTACVLSVGYVVLATTVLMPLFSDDVSQRFMVEQFGQFVEGESATPLQVLWAIARQPWRLLVELITPLGRTVSYLLAQWLPLAFVPMVSPSAWLMSGFPLLQILLRQDPSALAIDRRYAITMVPGLFYGAILWWAAHSNQFQSRFRQIWLGLMILAIALTLLANPNRALSAVFPDSFQPWVYTSPARQWQHAQTIRSLLAQIPPDASVSASSFIVPHISGRREALRFPAVQLQTDEGRVMRVNYAIADLWQFQQYQSVYPWEREQLEQSVKGIAQLLESDRYGLIAFEDGVALLQRRASSNPSAIGEWERYLETSTISNF
jgi:uncharacterized membrane protein